MGSGVDESVTDDRNEHAMVAWRVNNRERYNEYHRNYYHAHKDELSEKRKARYAANREQIKIKRMMAYRRKKEARHEADGDQSGREQAD